MTGRRRRATWIGCALAITTGAVVTLAGGVPVAALAPGGPIHLNPGGPVRVHDQTVAPGTIAAVGALGGHYVQFTASATGDQAGSVTLGPCGGTQTTVLLFEGYTESSLQRVAPGDCATLVGDAVRLLIDDFGVDGPVDPAGVRYVDLVEPQPIFDSLDLPAPLPTGVVNIPMAGTPLEAGTRFVALGIDGYTYESLGYVQAYQCGTPQPTWSPLSLNNEFGTSNVAFVAFSPGADLCLHVDAAGTAEVAVTLLGSFTDALADGGDPPPSLAYEEVPPPGFAPLTPVRVLDTRNGIGAPAAKLSDGQTVVLDLSAQIDPLTTAVVMNVTATDTSAWGYVTVYACDAPMPDTSNVNYDAAGKNVPNLVTVEVGGDGTVCLYTSAATHLLADLAGSYQYATGARFTALEPARILDTRGGAAIGAGRTHILQVTGQGGVPSGATAVTLNLTAVDAQGWGYVTAYPCDAAPPDASNINYVAGQTVPNLATVKLSAAGTVCLFTYAGTHLLADVAGFYGANPAGAGFVAVGPARLVDTRPEPAPVAEYTYVGVPITGGQPAAEAGIAAAVTNLTVTAPWKAGYLTAFPCTPAPPNASNVNYVEGQTVANQAVTKLSAAGELCVGTSATADVLVDLFGVFTTTSSWLVYRRTMADRQPAAHDAAAGAPGVRPARQPVRARR